MFIIVILILLWELINMLSCHYIHCFLLAFQETQLKTLRGLWALHALEFHEATRWTQDGHVVGAPRCVPLSPTAQREKRVQNLRVAN